MIAAQACSALAPKADIARPLAAQAIAPLRKPHYVIRYRLVSGRKSPMTLLTKRQEAFAQAYAELGNARQAFAMAGYSQNNSLPTQQKEAHRLLNHPKVAPRIAELQANARRRAEAEHGVTVDRLTDMYMAVYESSDTRPAGKMQAVAGLARLHGFI